MGLLSLMALSGYGADYRHEQLALLSFLRYGGTQSECSLGGKLRIDSLQ